MEFDEFAGTRLDALLRFARALTGDRGTAEDVVHDVVLRLHQRRDALSEITDLHAYARRMVTNAYLSWGRKWFRVIPVGSPTQPRSVADPADAVADRDELRTLLARLPRRQRRSSSCAFWPTSVASRSPRNWAAASRPSARTRRGRSARCDSMLPVHHTPRRSRWDDDGFPRH